MYSNKTARVVSGTEQKNSTSPSLPCMSKKATKKLIALPPEIDCNQTAMDLLLGSKIRVSWRNISDVSAIPSGVKLEWYE
jgi:hypothetical protein